MSTRDSQRPTRGSATDPDATVPSGKRPTSGPRVNQRWGRYRLTEVLGEGGMGTVYAAEDPELHRQVALKLVHDDVLGVAGQERLRREARAMARISHPNVVPVYEVGEHEGRTFYTMERVLGRSLKQWLEDRPPWTEIQRVFLDAGRGLAAIHAAGIAHRDIKPGNILVGDDGRARIADLGLALADPEAPIKTRLAMVDSITLHSAGTPAYMAPEQLRGEPGGVAADQFAFGLTLFEALTAADAFPGESIEARLAAMEAGAPQLPTVAPAWLMAAARRAIAFEPSERFADLDAMVVALARVPRRRGVVVACALLAALAAGTIVVWRVASTDEPACTDGTTLLAGIWDPVTAMRVTANLTSNGLSYSGATASVLSKDLDTYAGEWSRVRGEVCRATKTRHEQPESVMLARLDCLEVGRAELGRLTALLAGDRATARHAIESMRSSITSALASSADCLRAQTPRPSARATVDDAVATASAQLAIGSYADGEAAAARALDIARGIGDADGATLALVLLGRNQLARSKLRDAVASLTEAAASDHAPLLRIDAWDFLGSALAELGRFDDAARVLDLAERSLAGHEGTDQEIRVLESQGILNGRRGHYDAAQRDFVRALELATRLYGTDSYQLAAIHGNLATAARRLGNLDDALQHAKASVRLASALGADHPELVHKRIGLSTVLSDLGRYSDARTEIELALASARRGHDDAMVAAGEDALGVVLTRQGALAESVAHFRVALALDQQIYGSSPTTWRARSSLASQLLELGNHEEAVANLKQVLGEQEIALGQAHPDVASTHFLLANALDGVEDRLHELEVAQQIYERAYTPSHPEVAKTLAARAELELQRGRLALARELARRALTVFQATLPLGHPMLAESRALLAEIELAAGHPTAAIEAIEPANAALEHSEGGHPAYVRTLLVRALAARGTTADLARARTLAKLARKNLETAPESRTSTQLDAFDKAHP